MRREAADNNESWDTSYHDVSPEIRTWYTNRDKEGVVVGASDMLGKGVDVPAAQARDVSEMRPDS